MASTTTGMTPEQAQAALRTLLEGPAMSPPAGVIPNFHNPPNLNVFVTLTITLCVAFGTLAVLLRMYTKVFILRALAWEDYVIVLAWLLQIGETIPSGIVTRYGGGTHMWNVQLQTFFRMLYWINISAVVYGFVVFFIKLSILLQYLRIFAPTRKGNMFIYVGVHLCIWTNLVFYLTETVFEIAICTPREKIWNPLMTTGHCFSVDVTFQATGVFNVISDFAILILPMPCVWRLRLPLKKKILMTTIFATGLFACITSILRTYYTWKIVQSPDISYNMVPMGMWTYAELSTGIVISCLPVIPKFFQHIGPKVSSALTLRSKSTKESGHESASATPSDKVRAEKLKLPSFKHTFASVVSSTEKDDDHEMYSQQSLPKGEYVQLHEETAIPRRDATRELIRMPTAKLAATRDDLERGYGRF
ncbi:hypothetical protein HO173_012153 [Letharia columbiana]|uniref:Rhodopsin domain-containing protein n=1 Tax=Letharia columbiana TaxID=112416 RepID=A0A8H6CQ61_9LECA|nr:uncharacterized protein HO173_012153 [Letharia columbiana]KAF6227624.1 hypothetical protein HO173_012153 [Letharia columbiana]